VYAPADCPKARRAIELTLAFLCRGEADVTLHLDSPVPRGKGMASSTADVSAAIVATATALGARLSPAEVARLALQVEPSDGLMLPGIALMDHRDGTRMETLGPPPPMRVVVLDLGDAVDTLAFNAMDRRVSLAAEERRFAEALACIREGVRLGDTALVAQGATASASAYARIVPLPHFERALAFGREAGALGVCAAHSGSVAGLLFRDDAEQANAAAARARTRLPELRGLYVHRLTGGGVAPLPRARAAAHAPYPAHAR
jgi:L-threonine kinase